MGGAIKHILAEYFKHNQPNIKPNNTMNLKLNLNPPAHRGWQWMAGLLTTGLLLAGLTGCTTTHQVSESPKDFSGFLGDYSQLKKGAGDEANYIYLDESVNFAKYTKLYVKNVDLWKSDEPDSPFAKMSPDDQQTLVNFFHTAIVNAAANKFEIVDAPGPDVLVVHVAITESRKSKPVINLISSVIPQAAVISLAKQLITGTGTGVGYVQIEADFTDGGTGQRVAAIVDARAGGKAWSTKFNGSWGDVKLAFDWWSNRFVQRFDLLQKGDFSDTSL
jgi:hypothetical protein